MSVVLAVSLGGGLGALARYGTGLLIPSVWGTLLINVLGCLLIGVLMGRAPAHPLARPFIGVGILGGFTTFSTYAVEGLSLPFWLAIGYLAGTLFAAMAAVFVGVRVGRRWA